MRRGGGHVQWRCRRLRGVPGGKRGLGNTPDIFRFGNFQERSVSLFSARFRSVSLICARFRSGLLGLAQVGLVGYGSSNAVLALQPLHDVKGYLRNKRGTSMLIVSITHTATTCDLGFASASTCVHFGPPKGHAQGPAQ